MPREEVKVMEGSGNSTERLRCFSCVVWPDVDGQEIRFASCSCYGNKYRGGKTTTEAEEEYLFKRKWE